MACVMAVQYGMDAETLANRIGQPVDMAKGLLRLHRERKACQTSDHFPDFAPVSVMQALPRRSPPKKATEVMTPSRFLYQCS